MSFFLIMIAPFLILIFSVIGLFWWGAKGKEPYQ
ncbi:cytochrome bd oxidase small subunit CydS [Halalkalibacter nanhaiisediminis]